MCDWREYIRCTFATPLFGRLVAHALTILYVVFVCVCVCVCVCLCVASLQGGRPGQSDEIISHQLLDQYISAGGNFIDTADVYQHGMSERIIGQYLVKRPELRSRLIIATKVYTCMCITHMRTHRHTHMCTHTDTHTHTHTCTHTHAHIYTHRYLVQWRGMMSMLVGYLDTT